MGLSIEVSLFLLGGCSSLQGHSLLGRQTPRRCWKSYPSLLFTCVKVWR